MPRIAFINKLDRKGSDPKRVLNQLRSKLKQNAAFIQLPIGLESDCKGLVDVVNERAIYFEGDFGTKIAYDEIPKDMRAESEDTRAELVEYLANGDDILGELFLEEKTPTTADIHAAIRYFRFLLLEVKTYINPSQSNSILSNSHPCTDHLQDD